MENIEQLEKMPTPRESLFAITKDIEHITAYFDTFVNLAMEDGDVDLEALEVEAETEMGRSAKADLQLYDRDLEGEVVETYDLYTAARELLEQIATAITTNLEVDDWPALTVALDTIESELNTWQDLIEQNADNDAFDWSGPESLLTALRTVLETARAHTASISDGSQPEFPL